MKRAREVVSVALGMIAVVWFMIVLVVAFLIVCAFIPIVWIFRKEN